jgi:hypothetical protein
MERYKVISHCKLAFPNIQHFLWGDRFPHSSHSHSGTVMAVHSRVRLSFSRGEPPDHWEEFGWLEEALLTELRDWLKLSCRSSQDSDWSPADNVGNWQKYARVFPSLVSWKKTSTSIGRTNCVVSCCYRGLPVSEGLVPESSAAMGTAKSFIPSGEWLTESNTKISWWKWVRTGRRNEKPSTVEWSGVQAPGWGAGMSWTQLWMCWRSAMNALLSLAKGFQLTVGRVGLSLPVFCPSAAVKWRLKFPRGYVEETIEGESERSVLIGVGNLMIKKNWPGWQMRCTGGGEYQSWGPSGS